MGGGVCRGGDAGLREGCGCGNIRAGGAMATSARRLEVGTLEGWLWDAAYQIRGPIGAPKFKDYILPLVFLKRLSDVFEDEVAGVTS